MTKHGQTDITTIDRLRWGDGSDGDATWSGTDQYRHGVYQFNNLTIADGTEIVITDVSGGQRNNGSANYIKKSLIIFAQGKVTFGKNVVINGNRYGTNTGRNDYNGWRSELYQESWTNAHNANRSTASVDNDTFAITTGAGGGGGGRNRRGAGQGYASNQAEMKYYKNFGTSVVGNISAIGGPNMGYTAHGGTAGYNGSGGQGANGYNVDTALKNHLKEDYGYTTRQVAAPAGVRDDFPIAPGGLGGLGGRGHQNEPYQDSSQGRGGNGGGQICIVAQEIEFPTIGNSIDGERTLLHVQGEAHHPKDLLGDLDHHSVREKGQGGRKAGGDGDHEQMNSKASRGRGSSIFGSGAGAGGGGGGGTVQIVFNKMTGHPTIRCWGGNGGNNRGRGSNAGARGGRGGHGHYMFGWKAIQHGPITWIQDGNYGIKAGKNISNVDTGGAGRTNVPTAQTEFYANTIWPPSSNGYVSQEGDLT